MITMFLSNFIPQSMIAGVLLAMVTLGVNLKNRFIILMLLTSIPIFILGGHSNVYANIGLVLPVMIGMTAVLKYLGRLNILLAIIGLLIIIVANLGMIRQIGPNGQQILVIQKGMLLQEQLKLVDKTYQLANGQQFSINTITVPFWTNTTWAYLYHWYGQQKYGYVPSFYGQDQQGIIGNQIMVHKVIPEKKAFLIIESVDGLPAILVQNDLRTEGYKTHLLNSYNFGTLILEERTPKNT